jgi:hypothetical protein
MPDTEGLFAHALLGALPMGLPAAGQAQATLPSFELEGAPPAADYSRLPVWCVSTAEERPTSRY